MVGTGILGRYYAIERLVSRKYLQHKVQNSIFDLINQLISLLLIILQLLQVLLTLLQSSFNTSGIFIEQSVSYPP